jgi:hypothetical protein
MAESIPERASVCEAIEVYLLSAGMTSAQNCFHVYLSNVSSITSEAKNIPKAYFL